MTNKEKAIQYLLENNCSCACFDGENFLSSTKRGVAPLLDWLDAGICLENCSVADKVIGKGAAFLYLKLNCRDIHAQVISRPALALLQSQGVCVTCDHLVDGIQNRDHTGPCPVESAVLSVTSADEALTVIRARLRELAAHK